MLNFAKKLRGSAPSYEILAHYSTKRHVLKTYKLGHYYISLPRGDAGGANLRVF